LVYATNTAHQGYYSPSVDIKEKSRLLRSTSFHPVGNFLVSFHPQKGRKICGEFGELRPLNIFHHPEHVRE
jgi:hypothetical protein